MTFGIPLLFIYNGLITNIIIPILIICIFIFAFSIILIIIRIIDGKKNKVFLISKLERKNFLKNLGISLTLIVLIISISLSMIFYSKMDDYLKSELIKMSSGESIMIKEFKSDFIFKYILNIFFYSPSIKKENKKENIIKYFISKDEYIDILRKKIKFLLIPLFIISFNKIVKCFLIEVKYSVEQFLFFFWFIFIFLI